MMGLDQNDDAIHHALRPAESGADRSEFDESRGTTVGPQGVKPSGSQIQRAAAARMFVREAELSVFDDLFSVLR